MKSTLYFFSLLCVLTSSLWAETLITPKDASSAKLQDSACTVASDGSYAEFTAFGKKYNWPGPVFSGSWNLEKSRVVRVDLENLSESPARFSLRIDDEAGTKAGSWFQNAWTVPAKTRMTLETTLPPKSIPPQLKPKLFAMNGYPGGARDGSVHDWTKITRIHVFTQPMDPPVVFRLYKIKAEDADSTKTENRTLVDWTRMTPEEFFPMIDVYGQFKYEDWPGKIHSDAEFAERIEAEKADLAANPRPKNWSRYGGWADGPRQEATGRFYVKKIDGRWWFVDPDGFLFWSHGTDSVRMGTVITPITEREFYFENLPAKDSEFANCYGSDFGWMKYYKGKKYETFNFGQANLMKKYGPDFASISRDLQHKRLASWGMNSIGNWSDPKLEAMNRTPFTLTLNVNEPKIQGSNGYWGKFPDPFSPRFREVIHLNIQKNLELLHSPYCLGVFTNNELSWGNDTSLALGALTSPADQPAKVAARDFFRKKYGTIEKLNEAWKTRIADWEAFLNETEFTEKEEMKEDLRAFYSEIADQYFVVIHEELRTADPKALDFGCRFASVNELAQRAMARHVDVMSFNLYRETIDEFTPVEGIDLPVIVGEFHFGALDRGMFHTGLKSAKDQNDRANKYYAYVFGALKNPCIVGTHWFEYSSEATTGRFDGENYQIGLVDGCDSPYPELIQKVREIGRTMYEIRSEK